jgi:hypothetical protein
MKTDTFTPSINILRDFNQEINYIPTENAKLVYNQIVSSYYKGSRSFNLIGSYGSGKSAFIIALEQTIRKVKPIFNSAKIFDQIRSFEFLNIIGEHTSIVSTFASKFDLDQNNYSTGEVIEAIDKYTNDKNKALIVVIDEFGKFLEFAAKNNPDNELYFIQQLAELANDKSREILFITVLHKNYNAYSLELSNTQIEEWNKVKGRLVELNFNEPVEQLLFLASEKLVNSDYNFAFQNSNNELYEIIKKSNLFPLKQYNTRDFSNKIIPFDLLAVSTLTIALQEYAQNERSLFSFIENNDELGLFSFNQETNPFYNLACVYDYLVYYHSSFITTKYNPHLNQWNAIRDSIERAEPYFIDNFHETTQLIKAIGLLNIFSNKGGNIDSDFIEVYGRLSLGIEKTLSIIEKLISVKIIRFSKYDQRFKLLLGTDLDFELAINEAGNLVEKIKDITPYLNQYFEFPIVAAKRISFKIGTPRFFNYLLSDELVDVIPEGEIDGHINLIFSSEFNESIVQKHSSECENAILFGFYKETGKIEGVIFELEKIKKVIEKNQEDLFAVQELNKIKNHYSTLLNYYVIEGQFDESSVVWYFKGKKRKINNHRELNSLLSNICEDVYPNTPVFLNELVNKTKIAGTISTARKRLFSKILNENIKIDLGYESNVFPPDKMIFLSLIKDTGIYDYNNGNVILKEPTSISFSPLWNACMNFIDQTIETKRSVEDFNDFLKQKPFKLKQGFIDFWIPLFILIHRNELAIFQKEKNTAQLTYIPELNQEVLDLMNKSPKDFIIKKFDLTESKLQLFNKYREILNQIEQNKFTNKSFIETFKPFLVFYKSLPEYSKNTHQLSESAIKLRTAIQNSIDPEEAFFVQFPSALGYSNLVTHHNEKEIEEFAITIKEGIQEINAAYDQLISEIETFINTEVIGESLVFPLNKEALIKRYKKLKIELLKPAQKVFYQRIVTGLDERRSWINSICQACVGKSLENISDNEIKSLKHQILENIRLLDDYTDLLREDIDLNKEEVIKLEITSFLKGLSKKNIRIPKAKFEKIHTLEKSFKEQLKVNDKTFNIALLTKLLQDELNGDES